MKKVGEKVKEVFGAGHHEREHETRGTTGTTGYTEAGATVRLILSLSIRSGLVALGVVLLGLGRSSGDLLLVVEK